VDLSLNAGEEGFVVELDRFQGPLDLLLHLIRQQDIDIFDIPIAQITQQFLQVIERNLVTLGLDHAGEFLEMAATLIRIKAQMLLPRRSLETGELEDPRAELVRRLLEYEHFREAAQRLAEAEADRGRRYARGYVPARKEVEPVVVLELQTTWDEVYAAALSLAGRVRTLAEHRVAARAVPIEDKIGLIVQALSRVERIEFSRLVEPFHDKLHTVVTFMAGLELAKRRMVAMRQREPFAALWLYRVDDEPEPELPEDEIESAEEVIEEGSGVA
jgi:segregation and condensation protein A